MSSQKQTLFSANLPCCDASHFAKWTVRSPVVTGHLVLRCDVCLFWVRSQFNCRHKQSNVQSTLKTADPLHVVFLTSNSCNILWDNGYAKSFDCLSILSLLPLIQNHFFLSCPENFMRYSGESILILFKVNLLSIKRH